MKLLKQTKHKIKSKDIFGYQPTFNINSNSNNPTHKTFIGGFITIILFAWVFILVVFKLKQVVFSENNNLYFHSIEQDETAIINYNETTLVSFYVLRH